MKTSRHRRERDVAVRAVREAGRLCRHAQARVLSASAPDSGAPSGVHKKADRSPVTVADFSAQALICRTLAETFPEDPIVAEEDAAMLHRDAVLRDEVAACTQTLHPQATSEAVVRWVRRGTPK